MTASISVCLDNTMPSSQRHTRPFLTLALSLPFSSFVFSKSSPCFVLLSPFLSSLRHPLPPPPPLLLLFSSSLLSSDTLSSFFSPSSPMPSTFSTSVSLSIFSPLSSPSSDLPLSYCSYHHGFVFFMRWTDYNCGISMLSKFLNTIIHNFTMKRLHLSL